MSTDAQAVRLESTAPGLATIRLDRPAQRNALSQASARALQNALDRIAADPSVRAVILTGAGSAFCAGWALGSPVLDEAGRPLAGEAGEAGVIDRCRLQQDFAGLVRRLRGLDATVIAAVNGPAVGVGFALALAADIRLAARRASFHVGAVRIGLTAGECGISYHLPRLIGASRAFEAMLTGDPIDAETASRIGLVSSVVDDDALADAALALAGRVLRNSPYSTRQTKALMWRNLDAPGLDAALELENQAQVLGLATDDFREAAAAFAEKRPPRFSGR
ncbi:MAG: enoyl-CoA hydratase/isomerase family protein [Burkholderiaceae bacterium]